MVDPPHPPDHPSKPKSDRRQSKLKSIVNWRPKTKTSIKSLRDLVSSSSSHHNKSHHHHPQAEAMDSPHYNDNQRGSSTDNLPQGDPRQLNHHGDLESVEKVDSRSDAFFGRGRDPSEDDEHGSGSVSKPEPDYSHHRRNTSRDYGFPSQAEPRSIPQLSKSKFDVGPLHRSPEPLIEEPSKEQSEPSINHYSGREDSGHGISHQDDDEGEESEINCTDEVEEEEERRILEERMRSINERMESFKSQDRITSRGQVNSTKNQTSQPSQDQVNRTQNQPSMRSQDQAKLVRNQPSTGSLDQSKPPQTQNCTRSLNEEKEPPQTQNLTRSLDEDKIRHKQQEKDKYLKREAERIRRDKEEERMELEKEQERVRLEKEQERVRLEKEQERKSHQLNQEREQEDEYDYDHHHHRLGDGEEEDYQPSDEGSYSTHQEEIVPPNDRDSEHDETYHHETESTYHSQTENDHPESSSTDGEETREIKVKLSSPTERLKMLLDNPTNKLHQEQLANRSFKPTSLLTDKLGSDLYHKSYRSSLYPESNFSGSQLDTRSPASPYPDSLFSPSGQQFDSNLCFRVSSPIEVLGRISRIERELEELRELKGVDQINLKKSSSVVIQTAYRGHIARQEYAKRLSLVRYHTTLYPPTIDNLINYGTTIPQSKKEDTSDEVGSIMMLQRIIRSFLIRRRYSLVLKYGKAATQIQSTWRGYKTRHLPLPYGPPLAGVIRTLKVHRLEVWELSKKVANLTDRWDHAITKPERLKIDTTQQTFQDDEGIAISPLQRYNPSVSPIIGSGSDPTSPRSDRHPDSPPLPSSLPSSSHRSPYLAPSDYDDDRSTSGGERSPELRLNLPRIGQIRSDTNPETPVLPFRCGHTPNSIASVVPSSTTSDPSSTAPPAPITITTTSSPRDAATTTATSSPPLNVTSPPPLDPPVTRSDFDEIYHRVEYLLTLLEYLVHPPPPRSN